MTNDTTQLGPRVPADVGDDYRDFTKVLKGKTNGRLSDCVEEAIIMQMGFVYLTDPKSVEDHEDIDESQLKRFEEYRDKFLEQQIEAASTAKTQQQLAKLGSSSSGGSSTSMSAERSQMVQAEMSELLAQGYEQLHGEVPEKNGPDSNELEVIRNQIDELRSEVREIRREQLEEVGGDGLTKEQPEDADDPHHRQETDSNKPARLDTDENPTQTDGDDEFPQLRGSKDTNTDDTKPRHDKQSDDQPDNDSNNSASSGVV